MKSQVINYLKNINISEDLFKVLLVLLGFVVVLFILTRLAKLYLPKFSNGVLTLVVWCLIINLLFVADFLKLSLLTVGILFFIIFVVVISFSAGRSAQNILKIFRDSESQALARLYAVWMFGFFLLLVPFVFLLPDNTLIPAASVSSDSVVHSLLSMGKNMSGTLGLNTYWDDSYPRGFHSFIYYVNSFINLDIRAVLLPATLFGYSFIIFFVNEFLRGLNYLKGVSRFLTYIITFTPFLIVVTAYALFIPQVAVMPILLLAVLLIFSKNLQVSPKLKWLIISILTLATINIYGIYAFNVVCIAIVAQVLMYLRVIYIQKKLLKNEVTNILTSIRKQIGFRESLVFLTLSVSAIPIFIMLYNNLTTAFQTYAVTFEGKGNLGDTFLSYLHLTGIWNAGGEYRLMPDSYESYFLFGLLIIQIVFILKAKLSDRIIKLNLSLIFLIVLSLVVFKNQYIHFKYLTYYIPVFLATFAISFFELASRFERIKVARVIFFAFVLLAIFLPFESYLTRLSPLTKSGFSDFEYIESVYFQNRKTLLLTGDAWAQYYLIDHVDDYVPLNNYAFPAKEYRGGEVDVVIVDNLYGSDVLAYNYIQENPELSYRIESLPTECITKYNRFVIYDILCQGL
jgi:hypothetical protein